MAALPFSVLTASHLFHVIHKHDGSVFQLTVQVVDEDVGSIQPRVSTSEEYHLQLAVGYILNHH